MYKKAKSREFREDEQKKTVSYIKGEGGQGEIVSKAGANKRIRKRNYENIGAMSKKGARYIKDDGGRGEILPSVKSSGESM